MGGTKWLGAACVVWMVACVDQEAPSVEAPDATAWVSGRVLDSDGSAVALAEVELVVGSVPVSQRVQTDGHGDYQLSIPSDRVQEAWAAGQEVTVVITSPEHDLPPLGTAEGDRVHLLPLTLSQHVTPERVHSGAFLTLDDAVVPRQGAGFPITDELIADGGELTWRTDTSQYGEGFEVTLIVAPGSIHLGDGAQREITLTLIEQVDAPMAIPDGGFGPMWTIQPREVVFDPPARVRIEGDRFPVLGGSQLATGERTDLFGASLETGWKRFGEIELMSEHDGRVTLETPEGIIGHGAWGHVFTNVDADYGLLVECFSREAHEAGEEVRVPCAVLNDNMHWSLDADFNWSPTNLCDDPSFVPPPSVDSVYDEVFISCDQWDFSSNSHKLYATDAETVCATCGGDTAPYVVALTAGTELEGELVNGSVTAFPLCADETLISDMDELWDVVNSRRPWQRAEGAIAPFDDDNVSGEVLVELAWRSFSKAAQVYLPDPEGCE